MLVYNLKFILNWLFPSQNRQKTTPLKYKKNVNVGKLNILPRCVKITLNCDSFRSA